MRRSSGLAGLGIDNPEGRSSPEFASSAATSTFEPHARRDSRASLGMGLSRSSSQQSHMRQQSLTTACLPASSPDLTKRSFGARVFRMFDSESGSDGLRAGASSGSTGSSSTSPMATGRRSTRSLPVRLVQLAYLTFALVYTTASLFGLVGPNVSAKQFIPKQAAQQLPLSAMGDAWQAMRDRIPFQTVATEPTPEPVPEPDQPAGAMAEKAAALKAAKEEVLSKTDRVLRSWQGTLRAFSVTFFFGTIQLTELVLLQYNS